MSLHPEARSDIRGLLQHGVYQKHEAALLQRVNAIIRTNSRLYRNNQCCFYFRNAVVGQEHYQGVPLPRPMNRLHPSLREEMLAYMADHEALYRHEIPLTMGYVADVLGMTDRIADLYQLLPDSMHEMLRGAAILLSSEPGLLTRDQIDAALQKNAPYIAMLKQRMVITLLEAS